ALKLASPQEVQKHAKNLVADMARCRKFVVMDSSNEPIDCSVSALLDMDLSSTLILRQVAGKVLHTVPRGFEGFINARPALHTQDYEDVVCIMIDIAGSTRYAQLQPPHIMAELFHKVYMIVNSIVERTVFPFAYIHELVGDSVLIIVNAGFMCRSPAFSSAIVLSVATSSQCQLDEILSAYCSKMHARIGIAMGPICAGVVDGRTFRIFGSTVH
ncbi:unnamed protein product, partial [Polarella glacialis]